MLQYTGVLEPVILFPSLTLLILIVGVRYHTNRKVNQLEPPLVGTSVPYIGHVLGMIIHGGRYTKNIAQQHTPIFTLPMLGSRMYIVTDPALAATVQKNKSLSFNPIIPQVTKRILGLDSKTVGILQDNIGRETGPDGFYPEVHDLVYSTMTPGERLDDLTILATSVFQKYIESFAVNLARNPTNIVTEDLLLWVQHMVTIATADFLYGPNNPIALNSSLEASFWDFDRGLGQLLAFADLAPSLTARKAYKGREAVVAGLLYYFEAGHHEDASPLIRARVKIAQKYSMSWDGIARSELSFLFAGIVNTTVTSFWLLLHIFADIELLEIIRTELNSCTVGSVKSINPSSLPSTCPTLHSTYREVLRKYSDNSSNRVVTSNTLLADTYHLAQGSILQISGAAMHSNPAIFTDPTTFDPHRFHPDHTKSKTFHPSAFRAFGGGTTICPGRHFAGREILYFVALIVMKFGISSADDGALRIPQKNDGVLPVHVLEPNQKVMVKIKLHNSQGLAHGC